MKESFIANGFVNECEYLVADNSEQNHFDAYKAIRSFLQQAKGEYIILVHQDVRCVDSSAVLTERLKQLQQHDPRWAVCGNAGANGYKKLFFHLNDNGNSHEKSPLPARVTSLDENLLILKSDATLGISADLADFHFYGTDICLIADFLGYNSYVIEFMVNHLSSGNLENLVQQQPDFIKKYGRKLRHRLIQTTCTKFYLSNSVFKNKLYNNAMIFFWIKAYQRLMKMVRKES